MSPPDTSPLLQLPNTFRVFYGSFAGLHRIQQQAIEPVLTNRDLIIQSATGSGKTEAVLAPCLERIITADRSSAALYIVPTRALAFDIRRRFAGVLKERLDVRLAIRTGDMKAGGGGRPDIMLTTPESLDVMMGSAHKDLQAFLLRVRSIIIDEVHPLVHQYRGRQLAYLMQRLERRIAQPLQKIALSATIADPIDVCRFLHFKPDFVLLTDNVCRQIHPRFIHLKDDEDELINLLADLAGEWEYRKILIFANSRGRCDKIFGLLNRRGAFKGMALLHYSNLNTRERQTVEQRFRRQDRSVCVATSTLELGIDVGDVDAVLLFEPPDSVSAFLQRIGRANRRQDAIHFWGICRGGRAGEQLLRFLALLRLAEQGRIERGLSGHMPSVLSQQVISCLYEKKRLSLAALQELFPSLPDEEAGPEIQKIFSSLIKKNWLQKTAVNGLYRGGYQYWQALLEYRIWSNFPENEDQYQLLVGDKSVADMPKSVVRQIEPGDRVLLAGRRLRILWIDDGELKRVITEPARGLDDKELFWLGKGSHVSYEVARAMRMVLKSTNEKEILPTPGLFARSRELLRQELEKDARAVVLDNGIEVIRLANGAYQYRTFIGAVGNLILASSIKEFFAGREEDILVIADEIGLVCSRQVRFEQLALPLSADDFSSWIARHFKMMAAMFPMNGFCATLPNELLHLELAGFILDRRLLDFFKLCRGRTSAIVQGDPANLCLPALAVTKNVVQELPSKTEPLLEWDRKRRPSYSPPLCSPDSVLRPGAVTGTIIGEYFRHQQCERWLSLQFFRKPEQPPGRTKDATISARRRARGIVFEKEIISHLHSGNKIFKSIRPREAGGRMRSVAARFSDTMACLEQIGKQKSADNRYIVQPVLRLDAVLRVSQQLPLAAIGIPDLIQLRAGTTGNHFLLQVGDIKSSDQPRYYQKWQVAFYAWLLQQLIENRREKTDVHLSVADSGFILTPSGNDDLARRHVFALKPYLASMPAVLQNFTTVLAMLPGETSWHLRKHCVGCPGFTSCYQQALTEEDVQFIPGISRGVLQKMRALGVKTLQQKMDDIRTAFTAGQQKNLLGAMTALRHNTVIIKGKNRGKIRTDLFPANISTLLIVHVIVDPLSGLVQTIGLGMQRKGLELETFTWTAVTDAERLLMWKDFSGRLARCWHDGIEENRGPHILLFGRATRRKLLNRADLMHDRQLEALFAPGNNCHCTDVQQLLGRHFSLPLPGTMTLFALNRILGLMPEVELPAPESLFHEDRFPEMEMGVILELVFKLWQWLNSHLRSQWQKNKWRLSAQADLDLPNACLEFIAAEKLYQQKDIAGLMELTLAERCKRFRALGPLQFIGTSLDEEGKFLYQFARSAGDGENNGPDRRSVPAKFRSGDFLKLVPLGVPDLQSGLPVIMAGYNTQTGEVALYPRRGGAGIFKEVSYSLEEDGEDYHSAKLLDVVKKAFAGNNYLLTELFGGTFSRKRENYDGKWLQGWLNSEAAPARLNPSQQQALELPFLHALSLINGPPGTGKTHLLGWIIIALFRQAQSRGTPLRIAVSAVTHKAIDQVLNKLVTLVNRHELPDFPVRCLKWEKWEGAAFDPGKAAMQVKPCNDPGEVFGSPYLIVGATGFGLYNMLQRKEESATPPPSFDWVIFDEASQLLVPQALLSLIHGKGNFLFLGDVRQLEPIIRSSIFKHEQDERETSFAAEIRCSVLEILLKRYPHQSRQLDVTYRMNETICRFPSQTWYDGRLYPEAAHSDNRLALAGTARHDLLTDIIEPQKPVVLVGVNHQGCSQEAEGEARLLADIAARLLRDYGVGAEQIAILSPHRAQNNAIAGCLAHLLGDKQQPVIDTVERMQGAERDVILFGFTCSDPDLIFSEFLNNPNRFNVVLTRARQKIIIVGSKLFFESVASTEQQLRANACFKNFFKYCRDNGCYFEYPENS